MGRVFIGAVLAAIAMFAWGAVAFMVLEIREFERFRNANRVRGVVRDANPETGVYLIPSAPTNMQDDEDPDTIRWKREHEAGPVGILFLRADGEKPMGAITMIKGLLVNLLGCFIVACALWRMKLTAYSARFLLVLSYGLVIAVNADLANAVWWWYPQEWTVSAMMFNSVAWAVAGAVLAWIVKPQTYAR